MKPTYVVFRKKCFYGVLADFRIRKLYMQMISKYSDMCLLLCIYSVNLVHFGLLTGGKHVISLVFYCDEAGNDRETSNVKNQRDRITCLT